ncbi:MAG: HAD family hydrolase [archaeon]
MKTKAIALDIYGTVLCLGDPENNLPPRKGLEELIQKCRQNNVKVVTSSDASLDLLKKDLEACKVNLTLFDGFYELKMTPKDYSKILEDFNLSYDELLVIGDRDYVDLSLHRRFGGSTLLVPEYQEGNDSYNLSEIIIP